ncbi:MAG: hypothetical protein DCF27_12605, partial [Lysobacteraceae bacterium]
GWACSTSGTGTGSSGFGSGSGTGIGSGSGGGSGSGSMNTRGVMTSGTVRLTVRVLSSSTQNTNTCQSVIAVHRPIRSRSEISTGGRGMRHQGKPASTSVCAGSGKCRVRSGVWLSSITGTEGRGGAARD